MTPKITAVHIPHKATCGESDGTNALAAMFDGETLYLEGMSAIEAIIALPWRLNPVNFSYEELVLIRKALGVGGS